MSEVVQLIFSGLAVGGIYALIAVGFVTIYNVNGVINFAQGEFVMIGGMTAAALISGGTPLWLAFMIGVFVATLIGALVQRLAIYPARISKDVILLMITIGISTALRGVALLIWGSSPKKVPPFLEGEPFSMMGAAIPRQDIIIFGVAVTAMVLLYVFFEKTIIGTALRASMMNKEVSRLMGISPKMMGLQSFLISAFLAGIVGVIITPVSLATYDMGVMIGLKGFVGAVLGGLISIPGAVIGGLLLGLIESLGAGLISSGYKDAIAFIVLLAILIIKPHGIMKVKSGSRV